MKRLTRVLVLSGIVSLTNPFGTITGHANELIAAEPDTAPTKIVAQANTEFALGLYAQLSKENKDQNLFFSPYSISSALVMAAEGARGQTAVQMGKVLGFPDQAQRVGAGNQRLPWETALIHTGYKQVNDRLNEQLNDARFKEQREEIKKLREELEASHVIVRRAEKEYGRVNNQLDQMQARDPGYDQIKAKAKKASDELWAATQKSDGLASKINRLNDQIPSYELNVANALWGDQRYDFNSDYLDTIAEHYGTGGVQQVDFRNDFPGAAKRINRWAAEQTNQRIKRLIGEDGDPSTRLILTNAIFFKGDWVSPFEPDQTRHLPFHTPDGQQVQAPTMYQSVARGRYAAFNADGSFFDTPDWTGEEPLYPSPGGFAVTELPYKGNEVSMVLIVPNKVDGLPAVEELITPKRLDGWLARLVQREVKLYLPKFKQETGYSLKQTLESLGMRRAFDPGAADFSGISASASPIDRLYLAAVKHKAFISVDEKGTEAAAVTGGYSKAVRDDFDPEFRADRPFIYLIRDLKTGTILFMGRVTDPTAGAQ